ncbi:MULTISPECIES: DUF4919 domain-containing protein [unclassified Chryseobacterium]|uniref:DUF4919 domain-containing protein n=1 Tax=unclassified Chryseobacterium TaxID=2593645 RepID=UPI00226AC544|nr:MULTISPECIES: DUF4919 domain-containing protein [unclassified Chryseobacterium]
MKKYLFFLLLFISVLSFAQKLKPDFKSIEKNLTNKQSPYNYDKLIFKYKAYPKSLDSLEAQYLYYGRNFQENKVSTLDDDFKKLAEAFKEKNADECVKLGTALYQKDPTNLDVLLILLRAYDSKQDASNFAHHVSQFRLLTDAIKKSGDGKSDKTAYLVNSVGDEYILLNILQIGEDFTRESKPQKDGMMDVWEKDGNKVYIKVLYLDF